MNALKELGKKIGQELKRKLGLNSGALTLPPSPPKTVQARVVCPDAGEQAHGAPLVPKSVVRVLTGTDTIYYIKATTVHPDEKL